MNAVFEKFRGSSAWIPELKWPVMLSKKAGYRKYKNEETFEEVEPKDRAVRSAASCATA